MERIDTYLDQIRAHLHLDAYTEIGIIRELQSHFEEEVADLQRAGIPAADSVNEAIRSSGNPQSLARMFYEAHSQGSWADAFLALQPHLVASALFITHLWAKPFAVVIAFGAVLLVALYGWARGRPNWLYPWIGYSFSPFVATIFFSRDFVYDSAAELILGSRLSPSHVWLLLFLGLYALFIGLVVFSVVRVVKRDWLLVSFMLLPLPVFGVWISEAARIGVEFHTNDPLAFRWDGGMFAAFLLLGLVSVLFVRLRRRALRILLLAAACVSSTILVGNAILETSGFLTIPMLVGLALFTFLVPAVLEWILGHGEPVERPAENPGSLT
jgi:hypothetical protein